MIFWTKTFVKFVLEQVVIYISKDKIWRKITIFSFFANWRELYNFSDVRDKQLLDNGKLNQDCSDRHPLTIYYKDWRETTI